MKFKVGDEFIICGDENTLKEWNIEKYKNTIRTVLSVDEKFIIFPSPIGSNITDYSNLWDCPISCARKLTKLDKALK